MELNLSSACREEMDQNNLGTVIAFVGGVAVLIHAGMIWSRGSAKVADPFLLGPITGGVGYLVIRLIVGKLEVQGWGAKALAVLSVVYGLILVIGGFWLLNLPQANEIPASHTAASSSSIPQSSGTSVPIASPANPELSSTPQVSPQAMAAANPRVPEPKSQEPTMQPMPKNWRPAGLRPVGAD